MTALTWGMLRQLTETPAGPGDEGAVRDLIARWIQPHVQALRIDALGNLIAEKKGVVAAPMHIAVAAHMDEVALFITEIDEEGFLHMASSGGVNARTLLGKSVQVGSDRLPGVIGWLPPHHAKNSDEFTKTPDVNDLVVDIGADDAKAAKAKVKPGQRMIFDTPLRLLGPLQSLNDDDPLPAQGRISGKAFDDRMGCATLMSLLLDDALPVDITAVFTVQEEIGLRGALAAGLGLQPDVVIALEGTVCDDLPGSRHEKRFPTTRLGDGPALTQRDGMVVVHPPLLQHFLRVAAAYHIPTQFKRPNIGGTDAAGFARWLGMPTGIISTPCRYIHGPAAVAELSDFHAGVALLRASLPELASALASHSHP
ncbi:MAG: M42 family metallopeptidase [Chloroflexi bacterium]|nr:M42 family metallopeptidase [Chloroflexota bacterium]